MMAVPDPIQLLFGGMDKLGPGTDEDTLRVLRGLPRQSFTTVVDAGCGTGRQTLPLARTLNTTIHAVDICQDFLNHLRQRAAEQRLEHLIQTHCLDMRDIPEKFPAVDLLWSEGAAYNLGFPAALAHWAAAIRPGGLAVISELSWLHDRIPPTVVQFFATEYPDMRSVSENVAEVARAGYQLLDTHTLPDQAWIDGYYDVLQARAVSLANHPDASVQKLASEMLAEIAIFGQSAGSYGYVFYVMQRRTS